MLINTYISWSPEIWSLRMITLKEGRSIIYATLATGGIDLYLEKGLSTLGQIHALLIYVSFRINGVLNLILISLTNTTLFFL